jgi:hypothetical protein
MNTVIAPAKKIVAREPKVANGGMPSRNTPTYNKSGNSPTYNKDCHGSIPAKENVRATVAKVKAAR